MTDPAHLLNWQIPFDDAKILLLDQVVNAMYMGNNKDRGLANDILNQFKSHPDAWTLVDKILDKSQNPNAKFYALQILDEAVNSRWKILPDDQKNGIRSYIIGLVLRLSEDESLSQNNAHLLTKLNATLVSIVKQEWTTTWLQFIPDICGSARDSQPKCENTLNILKLLSEEVFDFSKNTIIATQASQLKQTMVNDFGAIFELCTWVLDQAIANPNVIKPSLIRQCLKTLQAFLSWIPLGYIFETNLVELVLNHFILPTNSRIEGIKCFTEIATLPIEELSPMEQRSTKEKTCLYFCIFVQKIIEITKNRSLCDEYTSIVGSKQQTGFENFVRQIALAITAVLKTNIDLIEEMTNTMEPNPNIQFLQQCVQRALEFMCQLTIIPEDELFKICLDFWFFFTYNVLMKTRGNQLYDNFGGMNFGSLLNNSFMHYSVYPKIMEQVREIMIDQMAKPKEVLVVIDENGEAVEEHFDDTETIQIYETMRETLIYLTNIDTPAMDRVIQARLDKITGDKTYFTFDRLNKLCWALGSISGCMSVEDENKFVVSVIKELLNLCEKTSGKSNKALVAADIMYVVGQFPRFLCSHWAFLKTVVKKLNEFMHEKHPGVQDMAAETFLKIAKLTKHMFVNPNDHDQEPYVNELIRNIPDNQKDLEQHQRLMVYEGIGHMISMEQNPQMQEMLVNNVMQYAHKDWSEILGLASQNMNALSQPEVIKQIDYIFKINHRVAESVGFMYLSYLKRIFPDLLKIYSLYSECISNLVRSKTNDHMLKPMKTVRRDILRLIQAYIQRANEFTIFNSQFLPPLKNLVDDYQNNDPNARDPEVLNLFATMLKKMGDALSGFLHSILFNLCQTTLEMIQNDFISYPEFREGFFTLVENIVKHCTQGLFALDSQRFQTIIFTILFALKHEKPEVMDIGLGTLHALNDLVMKEPQVATIFYQSFYITILKDVLAVLTDYRHVSGFKYQCMIFEQLLQIIQTDIIKDVIFIQGTTPHSSGSNKDFVTQFLIENIQTLFPNLNRVQIETFVINLFNHCFDHQNFKTTLRDLLISMKSFASQQDEFYLEEKRVAQKDAEEKELQRRQAIPGLVRPGEILGNVQPTPGSLQ